MELNNNNKKKLKRISNGCCCNVPARDYINYDRTAESYVIEFLIDIIGRYASYIMLSALQLFNNIDP